MSNVQESIVLDIAMANALYTMLAAMGHLLADLGWSRIADGQLVKDYTHLHPWIGGCPSDGGDHQASPRPSFSISTATAWPSSPYRCRARATLSR